jgi:hypothetical protein
MRVRIRRFAGLGGIRGGNGSKAKRGEEGVGESDGKGGAVAEPPWAVKAAGGLCRQVLPDAATGEAPIAGLASARRSNGSCSFPASRFHEWAFAI